MHMIGVAKCDTISLSIPSILGFKCDLVEKGDEIRISQIESKPDGIWYYALTSGWLRARDIQITRDLSFEETAYNTGLLDLQLFAVGALTRSGGLNKIKTGSLNNYKGFGVGGGSSAPVGAVGGGFGGGITGLSGGAQQGTLSGDGAGGGKKKQKFSWKKLGKDIGGIASKVGKDFLENAKNQPINGLFGKKFGGFFGQLLGGTSINDLLSGKFNLGNILNNMLGSFMDHLFMAAFDRLSYVLGFDLAAAIGDYYKGLNPLGRANGGDFLHKKYNYRIYTEADRRADEYFRYLGCGGRMIERHSNGFTWIQDASYATPLLEPQKDPDEVAFNTELYNADYSDLEDAIRATKDSFNYLIDRKDWFLNFNRYRITHPDYHLHNTRAYVFMTRPDLNIYDDSGSGVNPEINATQDGALFYTAIKSHSAISMSLTRMYSGMHSFIPVITNTARSLDMQDLAIKTMEHGETLTGWKVVYGRNMIESKTAGTISINFIDDNMLSVSYMHLLWVNYINAVSRGIYSPHSSYVRNGVLDYASALFYILTSATGEDIIYWAKYIGVFPTNYPASAFSFNEGSPVKTPDVQIQYAYSFYEPMNPVSLAEFNQLSSGTFTYVPVYNENTFHCNSTLVGAPFVDTTDGGYTYKLRWRSRDE